jgi:cytochrome P450
MTTANRYIIEAAMSPLPLPLAWPTPRNRQVRRALQTLDTIVYRMIEERRRSGPTMTDLLSMLLEAKDETDGAPMTRSEVRDEVMTLLLAGHETMANALSWTFYVLGQERDCLGKLHAEVDRVLGGRPPTVADVPALVFARQVLQESMRLYPPAYFVGRQAERDVMIGPCRVKRGVLVFANIYGMHRRGDYFHEPERFLPERFDAENASRNVRGAYIPFGAGPRICIGNHFAMIEGTLLLACLAQRVELERVAPGQIDAEPLLTLRPRGDLRMRVRRRARHARIESARPNAVMPPA